MLKIVVSSDKEKEDLLEASRHIHDSNVDINITMVNLLSHLYITPEIIEIDPDMRDGR